MCVSRVRNVLLFYYQQFSRWMAPTWRFTTLVDKREEKVAQNNQRDLRFIML